jgi:hypothetical protein
MKAIAIKMVVTAGSFLIGCGAGVIFHYTLYRMGLPLEPFIYIAF